MPPDRPLLRTCNALGEGADAAGGVGTPIPGLLRDVHVGLPPSGLKNGRVSLLQGSYEYFHYMQWTGNGQSPKSYDDCGWGCAYRSLMSILSWFRLQGYASVPNPTHYEIQKLLVDHCGQDAGTLLGKKMWLGSQDIAYYLDYALGVSCKTEIFQSGDDVPSGGRRLAHHFETQGTPIMIGGGELAFTLLGVDFDEKVRRRPTPTFLPPQPLTTLTCLLLPFLPPQPLTTLTCLLLPFLPRARRRLLGREDGRHALPHHGPPLHGC